MRRFAETRQCRMRALVRHFGDFADSKRACGQCDFCAPQQCVARQFRTITQAEREAAYRVVDSLRYARGQSIGKLHKQIFPTEAMSRDDFEELVGAMATAGLVLLEDATFEKGDRIITYRKASLTREGSKLNERTPVELLLTDRALEREAAKPRKRRAAASKQADSTVFSPQEAALEEKLRAWRRAEARKLGWPAYCVFDDRTLRAIVRACPTTLAELLDIEGIGPARAEAFGQAVMQICRSNSHAQGKS
jgi:superfamily II DNA helicase RecQ